jgi:hypothetical protein
MFLILQKKGIGYFFLLIFPFILSAQPIQLKWIGDKPNLKSGVGWGVPFVKGKITAQQAFLLTDNKNTEIQHQTWPLAYWPDGSVKWMGFAAAVPPEKTFYVEPVAKSKKNGKLNITEISGKIIVSNDILTCEISKKGNVFFNNLKINGKIISENGRLLCTLENREKWDEEKLHFENYESEIKEVSVEQSGPIRGVIKITGVHRSTKNNREILPFVVRLYFYSGLQTIRLVHSFVYDGDQNKDFIKGLGIVFDVPLREQDHNRHIRFSGENGGLWSESVKTLTGRYPFTYHGDKSFPEKQFAGVTLPEINNSDVEAFKHYSNFPSWDDYKLTQLGPNGFGIAKRTNNKSPWLHASNGNRASGLAMVGDASGGLAVSLKNFWQSYPSSLEINGARSNKAHLKVWFWPQDAEAMDLRHYDTIAHDLLATYEDVHLELSTPYGVAQTSELTLFPFEKLPTKQETADFATIGENNPQLICTPEYLHSVKAFGTWSLPDYSNDTKRWIENQLDSSILFYKRAIDEHHWYGFWNYGDVMHTYDADRHVWRYDIGGYAWANTELSPGSWLWYAFLRTGRADIYKMAEAMTRHTGEVDAYHIGEMKGLGTRHNVSHWGCGAKEARIGQAAWKRQYYYLTIDDRSGDLMREALDVEKALVKYEPLRIAQPRAKFPYNAPTRLRWGPDWLALAGNWMTEWERTGDIKYRDKIMTGLESLSKLPNNLFTGPNGLGYDPETGKMTYDGDPKRTNKNHLATIMGGFEILTEMFEMVDYKPFRETFTDYCKFYSMDGNDPLRTPATENWGDIGFRTPRLTAFAAKELNDNKLAERAWNEFLGGRRRPIAESESRKDLFGSRIIEAPDVLNAVHENPHIGTNGTSQWGLNAIIMLELIGNKIPDRKEAEERKRFEALDKLDWNESMADDFKKTWKNNWFLDGQKAKLTNTKKGLLYKAGATPASDADHTVLWTNKTFEGSIRIEFDFTRKDLATKFVNIIYLLAEGSGEGESDKDISKWNHLRTVPAMKNYFEHMHAYHISFAAFENDNTIATEDYIRARRYMPERGKGLKGTELLPEYLRTGFFSTDVPHHIVIIKNEKDIFMKVKNVEKEKIFHWEATQFPALNSGRIGLRLMGSRVSEFGNFKVSELK